ncbi:MAG: zf-HC2 domain-containing protein, partial [candidate division Zixibacteria bacterium]|nr:zf-HC2 domain-containing protein [candidate division Zixibacteria bacterium]
MNCKKTEEQLSRYIDGQLKPEEREKVEEHLKRCSGCSGFYEKLLALNKQAGEFRLGGNETYWLKQKNSIIRKIKEAETAKIVPIAPRRTRHLVFQFAAIAASIVLITYISIHELRENEPIKSLFPTETTTVQSTTKAIPSETVNKMKKEVSPQVETGINGEVPSAADKAMPKTIGETAYSRMALGDTAAGAAGGKIDESIGSMPTSVSMMAVEKEEKNRGKSPAAISKTD